MHSRSGERAKMKRARQKDTPAARKAAARVAREVPLMVPHGGGHAGSDFESAFELLQNDEQARELWHRQRVKTVVPTRS